MQIVQRVEQEKPPLVCIASLAPRGLAQARYLCKRLRGRFPNLTIVVGCLGAAEEASGAELTSAGANLVETTLAGVARQIKPLLALDQPGVPRRAAISK
ncbi:MAG: cobalamin B12-binding domain-containing protein [Gemmataceae bacterium]|nr:cobalamin B12-binding domain-containing protein [Gemmataceae bacterium]